MSEIVIAIISKGRPSFKSKLLFNEKYPVYVFVDNDEEKEKYEHQNPELKIVSCNTSGVSNVYNFMANYFDEGQKIVCAVDDVLNVCYKDGRARNTMSSLTKDQITFLIELGFWKCEEHGAKLWGVNPTNSGFIMMQDQLKYYTFIIGSFFGYINKREIIFPQELTRKHDYYFSAEHLLRFGKALRFDCFRTSIDADNKKGGGCGGTSNDSKGAEACEYLINHFPNIFKPHKTRPNEVKLHYSAPLPRFEAFDPIESIPGLVDGGNRKKTFTKEKESK